MGTPFSNKLNQVKRMKVAIITSGFFPVIDGVTVTVWNRLQQLSDRHHQALVFCPDYSGLESIYPNWRSFTGEILPGIQVINLPSVAFMDVEFERNISRQSYPLLLRELEKFQPDLIHVDEPDRLFLSLFKYPGVSYARRSQIPCVGFFHTNFVEYIEDYFSLPDFAINGFQSISKFLISRNYNSYNATLTASAETSRKLAQMGIKNAVVDDFLGVDIDRFHPDLRRPHFFQQTYGLANIDEKIKLVFLGRLTPDKGWAFTLDAFATLAESLSPNDMALVIAGDGPLRHRIADQLANLGFAACCLGRVPPDEVPALLINSDIHVTTSAKETKGLTILEAFAAGLPVLAPRAGGIIDSITDGYNGRLFKPGDRQDFLEKLGQLLHQPQMRQTLGQNARNYATQYPWNHAIDRLLHVWTQQIERVATRSPRSTRH
jgi:glycosyltransferase involved in cell wall biosynthesis